MKKIIKNIKIASFLNKIKTLTFVFSIMLPLTACGLPDVEQLDSAANDLKDLTEGFEDAAHNLTDAAGAIVDGKTDSGSLSDMAEKITNEGIEKLLNKDVHDSDMAEKEVNDYAYAYSKLSKNEKMLYDEVYDILVDMKGETPISSESDDEMEIAFKAVLADHPEIFWVDGYNYTKYTTMNEITGISMCGQYNCSIGERDNYQKQIEEKTTDILSEIDKQASDYEKVKAVYEYIIKTTEYDMSSEFNQDIRSVLLNGISVCQGYSKATQYLLNQLGVFATLVTGKSMGEGHAWNLVIVDGDYYYLDTTWGDASYASATGEEYDGRIPDINYDFFLVTTEDIKKTHKIGDKWDYPKCISNVSNYYIKEGLYFTSVDNTQLEDAFNRAANKNLEYISLKCADKTCFDAMAEYLIDDQNVFKYVKNANTLSFAMSDESMTIILWLR